MIVSGISIVVGLVAMMSKKKLGLLQVNPIWWVIPGIGLLAYGFYQKSKCPPIAEGQKPQAFPAEQGYPYLSATEAEDSYAY